MPFSDPDPTQPRPQRSLFGDILDWLLVPLLLLWPLSVVLIWFAAQGIANRPFDRDLGETARTLARRVAVVPGTGVQRVRFDLSDAAAAVLRGDQQDALFFQVLGTGAEWIAGERDLPVPERDAVPVGDVHFRDDELGGEWLGATIRYGELVAALDAAVAQQADWIELRRPARVSGVAQQAAGVRVALDESGEIEAAIAVHAEGLSGAPGAAPPAQVGLIGEVQVDGVPAGRAIERFTREGPLALLPLPGEGGPGTRWMSLVWCMPATAAPARQAAEDEQLARELQAALGPRIARVRALRGRAAFPLHEAARTELVEGRSVHLGNAAQTLHPVAGQGFNLAVRDARELALRIAQAVVAVGDPQTALADYAMARRADRAALLALTRHMPGLFASHRWPLPLARGLGLAALTVLPPARLALARLLMFGVRV